METIVTEARAVLEAAWDDKRGYCYPNRGVYPHQWLWDSCFHAIAWAAVGDRRALRELDGVFAAQLENGFVPHMRYARPEMFRGPLSHASSYTQPPLYAHTARFLEARRLSVDETLRERVWRGLDALWESRRTEDGLVFIVHPWEAGSDDSPRWDAWVGGTEWNRPEWTAFDVMLVPETTWGPRGDAVWSSRFVVAPAGFGALVAHALGEYARLTGDDLAARRRDALAAAIDTRLWDEDRGFWVDEPIVGEGGSGAVATLDGLLPLLVTDDADHAGRALRHLGDEARFLAPYGVRFVAADEPTYRPDGYWRGASWPQMNYLAWLAAARWGRTGLAEAIAARATAGTRASGFSEYWNPETGRACGATPQTWAAVAAAYRWPPLLP